MVGHTHEDIDQTFSCLSRHLQKCDALTMRGNYVECLIQAKPGSCPLIIVCLLEVEFEIV